ncbi:MAG: carbon starvation protein A [Candidatus Marinimicrobia bacterium]|nr:carbon starvation protein A [Candidatus Neomarinimicrobiota bacterium]MBT3634256.1 carbon starvation protein A [Candidatus Neomarinimicrobiota bacterium]MBT3682945.1 carbon starvation protein A [Candidatus Neomarinimicrobiota bacterium]MBT3760065.1 carbon starvation protein A [Candidatus Neomarinimicrobiota bacterium]MBT3896168.1 carbon starvation protein A [Candidatus Neomarinimicrobiota bacterium]
MNSIYIVVISLGLFWIGYHFYSKFISKTIYQPDDSKLTPAHEFRDDIDFVPTKKHILFGHHYTSIAGAAPIIGPCIAAYWGWLPAIIWVVLGTIFIGAVHDFGALILSVREGGKSVANISGKLINHRVRLMFLIFILLLVWLVLAVFSMAIAGLFVSVPTAVIPINIEIILAIIIGFLLFKKDMNALIPSLIALAFLYFFVWVGTKVPLSFESLNFSPDQARTTWIILLFAYSSIASLLPVWLLLQPRDYINSHQLFVGLGLLFLGILIAQPIVDAPAIRLGNMGDGPPIFPFLFVTIACGAISGFHGLVASGTSSKQLDRMSDARFIGYGSMLGEGVLALASVLAAVAGIALVDQCHLPSIGAVADLNWAVYYDSWAHAATNKATAFVLGGSAFLQQTGIPKMLATTIMAVLVISFAATTLDTATRIQRFIINELGLALKIKFFTNKYAATALAVIPAIVLALWSVPDPVTGELKQAGWVLWPIFGASNQMLAALTLMVLTLYFKKLKKPILPLLIPMIFIMCITIISLVLKTVDFIASGNYLLTSLNTLLIVLIFWMITEGFLLIKNRKLNG